MLHHLVSNSSGNVGKIVGIEHISELVKFSVDNLKRDELGSALNDGQIVMIEGDGRKGR